MKSGYCLTRLENFLSSQSTNGKGENSDQAETSKIWKKLWSIKALAKMKILLWRIAHDYLPTGVLLKWRHICTSDMCFFCRREETLECYIYVPACFCSLASHQKVF